ncbi:ribosome maturation factor [Treponema sp. OMZ 840]|uniref:ribosome maturation factor n=1 Tax=Treponema sp. OMZ 840 TaxID=244313 RepID=UPI003D93BAFD
MEYIPLENQHYYSECKSLVEGLGYMLIELKIGHTRSAFQIRTVISKPCTDKTDDPHTIGVNDCAKVHRLLLPRFEALLNSQDIYMEVTSPGMNRNIKNAAEFALFIGKNVRIWDRDASDWIGGIIRTACSETLDLELSDTGETKTFAYENIAKAKLADTEG